MMREKVREAYPIDSKGAMAWIRKIDFARSSDELADDPYPELEIQLGKAVKKCIKKNKIFLGRVTQMIERAQMTDGTVTSRQIIWHMYQFLMPRDRGEDMFDLQDLFAIGLGADKHSCSIYELEHFILKWEHVITGMKKCPSEDTLFTLFYGLVKHIRLLEYDMQWFDRLDEDRKTYDEVMNICLRTIAKYRADKNQRELHGRLKQQPFHIAAAPRDGSRSSSRGRRPAPGERGRSPSNRRSGSARHRTSGKSSPSRSPGGRQKFKRSSKGKICINFLKGTCTRGAGCKYKHEKRSKSSESRERGRDNKSPKPRGSRPTSRSPVGNRTRPVCNHFKRGGTCPYGDTCKFSHANPPGAAATPERPQPTAAARSSNSPAPEDPFR